MRATPTNFDRQSIMSAPIVPARPEVDTGNDDTPDVPTVNLFDTMVVRKIDIKQQYDKALSIFNNISEEVGPKHAVLFFENIIRKDGSQQMKGECMMCHVSVASTGAFKFHSHIIKCHLYPIDIKKAFDSRRNSTTSKAAGKRELQALQQEELQLARQAYEEQQAKLKQQCIKVSLKSAAVEAADVAIANFFYANGLPFSVASARADSLYRAMITAIQAAPASYVPPIQNRLGGELLDKCYEDMWKKIKARDADGQLVAKFGSTYVSDGWDSCDSLPLINSAFITANDGGVFWRSVDTSGKVKSAEYCAALMIADIYAYGPTNVVMIVTDTCSTMQKCWQIIEDEFPWVSVLPCQAHVISLLMKDVAKTDEVKETIIEEATVVQWFANHQFPLAKLREHTLRKWGKAKELVKAGATRFGTNTLVGQRLLELKAALQATVVDEEYVKQNYKDKHCTEEEDAGKKVIRSNKGATTRNLILDETKFWPRVQAHVSTTLPIFKMLRR